MFFIGVFGTGDKEQDVAEVVLDQCPNCPGTPTGHVVTRFRYFHIFFIPVHKWGREYAVYCPSCRTWFQLDPEVGGRVESGELKTLNYWQLKNKAVATEPEVCRQCGSVLDPGYTYCPHCGRKR